MTLGVCSGGRSGVDVHSEPGIGVYLTWSGLHSAVVCGWGLHLDRNDLDLTYKRDTDDDDHRRLTEVMILYF